MDILQKYTNYYDKTFFSYAKIVVQLFIDHEIIFRKT